MFRVLLCSAVIAAIGLGACKPNAEEINLSASAICGCSWSGNADPQTGPLGGCLITKVAPPGYACKCSVTASLANCAGVVTTCNATELLCQNPDMSYASCELGGGDCKGYNRGKTLACSSYSASECSSSACESDFDCENNSCGRLTADDDSKKFCCPGNDHDTYGGFDYCTGMINGSRCWSDAMCARGYCKDNLGGLQRGTCSERS